MSSVASYRYAACPPPPPKPPSVAPCKTDCTSKPDPQGGPPPLRHCPPKQPGGGPGGAGPGGPKLGGRRGGPAGNPFTGLGRPNQYFASSGSPPPAQGASYFPIRYANGGALLSATDVAAPGGAFFHTRHYCNQASAALDGPNGYNWWLGGLPYIVQSGTSVAVVSDPNNPYWFDQSGGDYAPRYGVVGVALVEDLTAHTLTFLQTTAGQIEVTVFNDFTVWPNPGGFLSYTDFNGKVTTAIVATDGTTASLTRSFTAGTTTITESLLYTYYSSGPSVGKLQSVTLQRQVGSGSPTPILQSSYTYYDGTDGNGALNDLQSATRQIPDGSGGWLDVAVEFYRYYLGTETTGIPHGLKLHFGPEAYRLIFNAGIDIATAPDAVLLPYADHYFEYDPTSGSVTREIAAVCPGCPGGGTTADLFSYTPNPRSPAPGYNVWAMQTVQTLPDSSQIIVYSNYAGLTMLMVSVDPGGTNKWCTFYRYNADGQLIWTAMPSAVTGYDDTYHDLLHYNTGTSLYTYLNNSTGLIYTTDYYTTTGSGAVIDYVQYENVRQGQIGSDVRLRSYTYTSNID